MLTDSTAFNFHIYAKSMLYTMRRSQQLHLPAKGPSSCQPPSQQHSAAGRLWHWHWPAYIFQKKNFKQKFLNIFDAFISKQHKITTRYMTMFNYQMSVFVFKISHFMPSLLLVILPFQFVSNILLKSKAVFSKILNLVTKMLKTVVQGKMKTEWNTDFF